MGFFGVGAALASPWFSSLGDQTYVGSNNTLTTLTASATPHTNGSWTQIISSTSGETTLLSVVVAGIGVNARDSSTLLSIGVGASGSESSIISGIAVGSAALIDAARPSVYFFLPVKIASGSRISARIQSVFSSQTAQIGIYAYNFGASSFLTTSLDVIGTDTATSKGTQLSASNAWTEIISSTTKAYSALTLVPSLASTSITSNVNSSMEIGIGASGSEVVIGKIESSITTSESISMRNIQFNLIGKEIPSGTRIAVRQSSSLTEIYACVVGAQKV